MDKTLMVSFFLGLTLTAALGVLFSKRMVHAGISLFGMLMAVAGIFATLGAHSATFAQIILYVGGVMVLVVFALFLNPEPGNTLPKWKAIKQNLGKAFILLAGLVWIMFYFPFQKFNSFFQSEYPAGEIISKPSLTGRELATTFGPEFEVLGLLLFAAIVLAGSYLKTQNETQNK
jgi:NADH-quinone oxidoreductase subunit J